MACSVVSHARTLVARDSGRLLPASQRAEWGQRSVAAFPVADGRLDSRSARFVAHGLGLPSTKLAACPRLHCVSMSLRLDTHIIRIVSRALDTAIAKMSVLPPEEQDQIAQWLLGELQDEERWTQAFSGSQDALSRLAGEARADIKAGRATQLDPDKL